MERIAPITNLPAPLAGAYAKGYAAYFADRSRFTNPLGGPEWFAWDSGWTAARREAEGDHGE